MESLLGTDERILELQRLLREEQRRLREEQRRRREAEELSRKTTLVEYLDLCHTHLQCSINVPTNTKKSTKGKPENAYRKTRPNRIRPWQTYDKDMWKIWETLRKSSLVRSRLFDTKSSFDDAEERVKKPIRSEMDLNAFLRETVEYPVARIITKLYDSEKLRLEFGLRGTIAFENHANTLEKESLESNVRNLDLNRNSTKSLGRPKDYGRGPTHDTIDIKEQYHPPPNADQFCVYNESLDTDEGSHHDCLAYVSELKAPHKLTTNAIYMGLKEDIDLDDIVCVLDVETVERRVQRMLAAVITQAFSYMVSAGVMYGCVCTGEATIFLRVPEDPRIVEYYFSVPKHDVTKITGWNPNSEAENRLHLTAVGHTLSFTLLALQTKPRSQKWRNDAIARLKKWQVTFAEVMEELDVTNTPGSEYKPQRSDGYMRSSPVMLRSRTLPKGCRSSRLASKSSDNEEPGPDTPTPSPWHGRAITRSKAMTSEQQTQCDTEKGRNETSGRNRNSQYCTQVCLLGLRDGGRLDTKCPNFRYHGVARHNVVARHIIDGQRFLQLISRQLAKDPDEGCEPIGHPGSRGLLFKITLRGYEYTVAAKGTPSYFASCLQHESRIYERLRPIQGINVPVYLGSMKLILPYFYGGITVITDMMFLSFAGHQILSKDDDRERLRLEVGRSVEAVHRMGILQNDAAARNILWHDGRAMIIDFERATIFDLDPPLATISGNVTGKRQLRDKKGKFLSEAKQAASVVESLT